MNTASRGETLVRGFRRVVGTVTGIAAGLLIAIPIAGSPVPTAALVAVSVFGIFYTAAPSYSWMMFFVTVMAGLLYGLLGVLHPGLLLLRFQETAVGALGAALGVALILPVTTHAATDAWIRRAVHCVHGCTAAAARRLAGDEQADPAPLAAELELLLGRVRLSLAPLVHPLSPLRARKARARQVIALLDDCAREIHGLTAVAADLMPRTTPAWPPPVTASRRLCTRWCRRPSVRRRSAWTSCRRRSTTLVPRRHSRTFRHSSGRSRRWMRPFIPRRAPPRARLTWAADTTPVIEQFPGAHTGWITMFKG